MSDRRPRLGRVTTPGGNLVFAMTGADGVCGGIASVNRNLLRALVHKVEAEDARLTVLSLHERATDRPAVLPARYRFQAFEGNKMAFAAALIAQASGHPLYLFDHVTLALPLLPLAALGLTQTVIFAHGSEAWRKVRFTSRLSMRFARLCLANSEYTLHKMRSCFSGFRGAACPLGLPPEYELPELPPERRIDESMVLPTAGGSSPGLGPRVLLLVGRMDPHEREKGHRQLLRVLPNLLPFCPEAQLVFAGPGADREPLRRAAVELGIGEAVLLPGYLDLPQLQALYASAYAFVMPSRQEGFGLVYLEAMSWALPCVGCHDDGSGDVIVDGETGLLVANPDDADELLSVLLRLVRNPEGARAMGVAGFHRVRAHFTAKHFQNRLLERLADLGPP